MAKLFCYVLNFIDDVINDVNNDINVMLSFLSLLSFMN